MLLNNKRNAHNFDMNFGTAFTISLFIVLVIAAMSYASSVWVLGEPNSLTSGLGQLYNLLDHRLSDGVTPESLKKALDKNDLRRKAANAVELKNLDVPESVHIYNNPLALNELNSSITRSRNYKELREKAYNYHPLDNIHHPFSLDLDADHRKTVHRTRQYRNAMLKGTTDIINKLGIPRDVLQYTTKEEDNNMTYQKNSPLLANPLVGGHCSEPQLVADDIPCVQTCFNENAIRLTGPIIFNGQILPPVPEMKYCWAGSTEQALPVTGMDKETHSFSCSLNTSILFLEETGVWRCSPQFPAYFRGSAGQDLKACGYDRYKHNPLFKDTMPFQTQLVDTQNPSVKVRTSGDFFNTSYVQKMLNAGTKEDFVAMATNPDFLFENRLACDCGTVTDIFSNKLQTMEENSQQMFYGLTQCNHIPCAMTSLTPSVYKFDPENNTCTIDPLLTGFQNVKVGDNRTPVSGVGVSALGIRKETTKLKIPRDIKNATKPNVEEAKYITRLMSPVIPARNLDSTNTTRNVMYVPTMKNVMAGKEPGNLFVQSEIDNMLAGCMHAFATDTNNKFSYTPVYVEPYMNVLANNIPQKPLEHQMMANEALRDSRMVSGNVFGGSEMLYSLMLSRDAGGQAPHIDNPDSFAEERINQMRRFYDDIVINRRLSTFERLALTKYGLAPHGGGDHQPSYSRWDTLYRINDFDPQFQKSDEVDKKGFCLREGLMIRHYRAYAGLVLTHNMREYFKNGLYDIDTRGNVSQMVCPSTAWRLPFDGEPGDYLSVDHRNLYSVTQFQHYMTPETSVDTPIRIFPENSPHYNTSFKDVNTKEGWGLNKFRYYENFSHLTANPNYIAKIEEPFNSDIQFDYRRASYRHTVLPCSFFKVSNIEWGHEDSDLKKWTDPSNPGDLTPTYLSLLDTSRNLLKGMWWNSIWPRPNFNYYNHFI